MDQVFSVKGLGPLDVVKIVWFRLFSKHSVSYHFLL